MNLSIEQKLILYSALPNWSVKSHPTKKNMSVIHPMAVIDRLNEVFGIGGWNFTTEFIKCELAKQKTLKGERDVWISAVKGSLKIDNTVIEQYGGNTNDDAGDSLKGSATDALTKCASYLGIGAEIYKGNGNVNKGDRKVEDNNELDF